MRRNRKNNLVLAFVALLLIMGLGYALLNTNLSINGTTNVSSASWNIYWDNIVLGSNNVTDITTPATISTGKTEVLFNVNFKEPGDTYEFTVDAVNDGSIDGMVNVVTNGVYAANGTTSKTLPDYLEYTVTYSDGIAIEQYQLLKSGERETYKVRVHYKEDITASQLPSTADNYVFKFEVTYVQADGNAKERERYSLNTEIQKLIDDNSSCMTKYSGQVTDQVGSTVTASNVYFNKCEDKRNIIFNNMCWQMIRTTENSGIKMVYNGDAIDGKCVSGRSNHNGIVQSDYSTQTLNSSYVYGDLFTYDTSNRTFTLTNPTTATWSNSTYEGLIGKYTCKNTTGTCTTLYNVNGYVSNTSAYTSSYTIGSTSYAQIGTSSFNANFESLAMVGYMFNKVYLSKNKSSSINGSKFGSTYTYNSSTNTYTLSGTTQNISNWSTGYNSINNTHYTCWNTTGSCTTISYIYFTDSNSASYIDITGGKGVNDTLGEMLSNNDVNRYNSSIKGIIDAWYKQNMSSKTSMLEDTVYCSERNITNYGGWKPDGGSTGSILIFENANNTTSLACSNLTDQFATSNNNAKLIYPVALINNEEWLNIGSNSLRSTGAPYWGFSPFIYFQVAFEFYFYSDGAMYNNITYFDFGVRPAITLKKGTRISGGEGSETDPFVIAE